MILPSSVLDRSTGTRLAKDCELVTSVIEGEEGGGRGDHVNNHLVSLVSTV